MTEQNTKAPQKIEDDRALYRAMFRWTFFDPANLISICGVGLSAILVVLAFRARRTNDLYMPIGFYLCVFAVLRGYFFAYYHSRRFWRGLVWLILTGSLLASGFLWEDRAGAYNLLLADGVHALKASPWLHIAAILHAVVAAVVTVHLLLPRRWLIRKREVETGQAPMKVEE